MPCSHTQCTTVHVDTHHGLHFFYFFVKNNALCCSTRVVFVLFVFCIMYWVFGVVLRPSFAGLDIWDRLTGGGEASVRMHRGALADLMMQHDEDCTLIYVMHALLATSLPILHLHSFTFTYLPAHRFPSVV